MTTGAGDRETNADDVVLRAEGIEKTYGGRLPLRRRTTVLTGADLELHAHEIVGIVGENGSGKSTLLKILVGALDADGGTISGGASVGWCPQDSLLYERLTIEETFRLFADAYGMSADHLAERQRQLADQLDFTRFLDQRIDRLSGGNRRKVDLSVALLHDPDVLLLDEPYTGFDWETYLAFWQLSEDLSRRGTAVAVISHLINEQERFDRIYQLRDGGLRLEDSPGA